MKIAPVADIKANFSEFLRKAQNGPVVVTKNGRPVAVLLGLKNEEEIERLLLGYSTEFQALLERGRQEKGFTVNLFLDENGEYLAHFVELPNVSAFGESPEEALSELATAWEGANQSYKKHGEQVPLAPVRKKYSGQFNERIDRRLHRALAIEAAKASISLNAVVSQKLAKNAPV